MADVRSELTEAFPLAETLPEETPEKERRPAAASSGVLHRLKTAWSTYQSDNRRGWSDLAEEQARNPTLA